MGATTWIVKDPLTLEHFQFSAEEYALLDWLRETTEGDRSKLSYAFVGACLEAGLSEAETVALALEHAPTVGPSHFQSSSTTSAIERSVASDPQAVPRSMSSW